MGSEGCLEITGLSSVVENYKVFAIPYLGTIHTGTKLSESSYNCLVEIGKLGKNVAIFSNMAKRRNFLIQELARMGVPPSLYQHVITAGEVTYQALSDRRDPFHAALGRNCYIIGSSDSFEMIKGLDLHRVTFVDEADFILNISPDEWHNSLEDYIPILESAAKCSLPMVCANSDKYVYYNKEKYIRPGALADYYKQLGGEVACHGKPSPDFYEALMNDIEPYNKQDVLILGDSLNIDVVGARNADIDSVLCITGTTISELGMKFSEMDGDDLVKKVQEKITSLGLCPKYIIKKLVW